MKPSDRMVLERKTESPKEVLILRGGWVQHNVRGGMNCVYTNRKIDQTANWRHGLYRGTKWGSSGMVDRKGGLAKEL